MFTQWCRIVKLRNLWCELCRLMILIYCFGPTQTRKGVQTSNISTAILGSSFTNDGGIGDGDLGEGEGVESKMS